MSFQVKVNASDAKIEEAKAQIIKNDGVISGNSFSVKGVRGSIDSNGDERIITITDKPWLASQSYVSSEIKKFFS